MRAIKRYYANWGLKTAEYYKKCLDKALNENLKNETKLRFEIKKKDAHIRFLTNQYNALADSLKKCNDEYLALLNSSREYRSAMHYYREKMIEGNEKLQIYKEKLQIYKNAVDEFIKRHPEFNEELNEIIRQEEEESEEAEED